MHANCCLRSSWNWHEFLSAVSKHQPASQSELGTIGVGCEEASANWDFTVAIRRLQDLSLDTHEVLTGCHKLALAEDIKASMLHTVSAYH